jgi:hypothetical protein
MPITGASRTFLAVSQPDGTTKLLTVPERRVDVSNSTLIVFARETRDVARVIAEERGLTIPQLAELDAAIAAHPYWAEAENDEATGAEVDAPPPE